MDLTLNADARAAERTSDAMSFPPSLAEVLGGQFAPLPRAVAHKLTDVLFPATPPKIKNARLVRGIRI